MTIDMLTLQVLSPLAIHAHRASEQFSPTLDFIPGSAIRGAFADIYLAGDPNRADDAFFQKAFLSEQVLFSDFLPTSKEAGRLTRLSPATAVACKRFERHYSGSLSDNLLWLELLRDWDPPELSHFKQWRRCPECTDEDLDGKRDRIMSAYYTSIEHSTPIKVSKRMIAGTAIDRNTKTVAHGMLFSHEVIEESGMLDDQGVHFRGTILLPEDFRTLFHEQAPRGRQFAVGYGRSRGLGQVQVDGWDSPRKDETPLRERWEKLNEAVRVLWGKHGRSPGGLYFSLSLQSHLAMRNGLGQPVLGEIQASDLGLPAEAERCRCVLSAISVPGWNAAQGLPKMDTWMLGRGSVLLFRLPLDMDIESMIDRLTELERDGIGERRSEGFGRLIACDPFHYHFSLNELHGG